MLIKIFKPFFFLSFTDGEMRIKHVGIGNRNMSMRKGSKNNVQVVCGNFERLRNCPPFFTRLCKSQAFKLECPHLFSFWMRWRQFHWEYTNSVCLHENRNKDVRSHLKQAHKSCLFHYWRVILSETPSYVWCGSTGTLSDVLKVLFSSVLTQSCHLCFSRLCEPTDVW